MTGNILVTYYDWKHFSSYMNIIMTGKHIVTCDWKHFSSNRNILWLETFFIILLETYNDSGPYIGVGWEGGREAHPLFKLFQAHAVFH